TAKSTIPLSTESPESTEIRSKLKTLIADVTLPFESQISQLRDLLHESEYLHLQPLIKEITELLHKTEEALKKHVKEVSAQWRTKLNGLTSEILKTPDLPILPTSDSQLSKFLNEILTDSESADLSPSAKNQIYQSMQTLFQKRPTKLNPVFNPRTPSQVSTPGLQVLKRISVALEGFAEGVKAGVLTCGGGLNAATAWVSTVMSEVERAVQKQEEKVLMHERMEREKVERERIRKEERERERVRKEEEQRKRRIEAEKREAKQRAEREEREKREAIEAVERAEREREERERREAIEAAERAEREERMRKLRGPRSEAPREQRTEALRERRSVESFANSRPSRRVCTFFQQGNCRKGDACTFLHETSESTPKFNYAPRETREFREP
ncbi:hypothetical protein HDV05_002682, partial [Chytridiales sp. JEL 0842]